MDIRYSLHLTLNNSLSDFLRVSYSVTGVIITDILPQKHHFRVCGTIEYPIVNIINMP